MNAQLRLSIPGLKSAPGRGHLPIALLALLTVGWSASAATTNTPPGLDAPSFKIITERNIFDQNRRGGIVRYDGPKTPQSRIDAVILTGVITSEKGPFAFFESDQSQFQKVAKVADTIAGFKITDIQPSFVKLASATNEVILLVGKQLQRQDNGPWQVTDRTDTFQESSSRMFARDSRDNRDFGDRRGSFRRSGDTRGSEVAAGALPNAAPNGQPQVFILDPNGQMIGPDSQADDPAGTAAAAPAPGSDTPPAATGDAALILQRMMERRRAQDNQ